MNRYFNPRTPVGCDRDVSDDNTLQNISIHAPQWGATVGRDAIEMYLVISIHAPQWGATRARLRYVRRVQYFNPRTPVGCDASCWNRLTIIPNFNPRTPVGCDGRSPRPAVPFYISIHAPQWGATTGQQQLFGLRCISIHAPQWGATNRDPVLSSATIHFNPRTPVGCDVPVEGPYEFAVISIHAPQWGATRRKPCHVGVG